MPKTPARRAYCPACGVNTEVMELLVDGDEAPHCATCGLRLDEPGRGGRPSYSRVITAEDSSLLREMVADALKGAGLAHDVVPCRDGREFVEVCRKSFRDNAPISLAILDVHMPGLNGIDAAEELRTMEKKSGRRSPVPFLFFTIRTCDEAFKKVLNTFHPSAHINKGITSSPDALAQRVCSVVKKLLTSHREGWT